MTSRHSSAVIARKAGKLPDLRGANAGIGPLPALPTVPRDPADTFLTQDIAVFKKWPHIFDSDDVCGDRMMWSYH